jgi:hypothetical protein
VAPARAAAYAVLLRAEREPGPLDLAVGARPELAGLTLRDRSLAFEPSRHAQAAQQSRRRAHAPADDLSRVDVGVRAALRLGASASLPRPGARARRSTTPWSWRSESAGAGGFARRAAPGRRRGAGGWASRRGRFRQRGRPAHSHPEWLDRLWRRELGDAVALALLGPTTSGAAACASASAWGRQRWPSPHGAGAARRRRSNSACARGPVRHRAIGRLSRRPVTPSRWAAARRTRRAPAGHRGRGGGEIADLCAAPGAKTSQPPIRGRRRAVVRPTGHAPPARHLVRQRLDGVRSCRRPRARPGYTAASRRILTPCQPRHAGLAPRLALAPPARRIGAWPSCSVACWAHAGLQSAARSPVGLHVPTLNARNHRRFPSAGLVARRPLGDLPPFRASAAWWLPLTCPRVRHERLRRPAAA